MNDFANISDESLVARVRKRDHQAFAQLVERHTQKFYAAAYRIVGDGTEAEDIVQDAFLKLWDKPGLWKEGKGAKFTTWFYKIVTNMAIDVTRKRGKVLPTEQTEIWADERTAQDEAMAERQQQKALEEAIQSLPENQKVALNLCFYEGLSNKEAADVLDIGVKALESLLMRAKAGVRDHLIRENILQVKETG
jgi:RNA polymerase sigma-70 factor (ECF subfamily)